MIVKGKSETYQTTTIKGLKQLAKTTDLSNPAQVELTIAKMKRKVKIIQPDKTQLWIDGDKPVSDTWRQKLVVCYSIYCKLHGIEWKDRPKYRAEPRAIQPPTQEQIGTLIASAKGWLSLKIQISMETGLRPIEITGNKGLRVRDIHPEQQTITALSTKGCNPRPPMKITANLLSRLQNYIQRRNLQPNDLLFTSTSRTYGNSFRKFKKHLSKNLANPIYESIRLYDIRHYYVTRKARKIQNAEIVRQIVGHKYLNTTQKYMHLAPNENLEYDVVTTKDQKQVDEYLAQDYTYVLTTPDGYMKFRRPK